MRQAEERRSLPAWLTGSMASALVADGVAATVRGHAAGDLLVAIGIAWLVYLWTRWAGTVLAAPPAAEAPLPPSAAAVAGPFPESS